MFRITGLKVAEDADENRQSVSMSTAGMLDLDVEIAEEKPEHLSMDGFDLLDFDAASASWLFDSAASAAFSVPLSPPSRTSRSSSHLPFSIPPPLSPLWIFDDKPDEIAGKLESELGDGEFNDEPNNEKLSSSPLPSIKAISDRSYLIKERMMQALQYIKQWTNQHVMVQVWAPLRNGDHYVLSTSKQPFVLDPHADSLLHYRIASLMYMFSVDGNNDGILGLPGRVFSQRLPEWTPNVRYYSSKEFPRLSHALAYNVRGSLALPVFEPSQQSCVGVVELIMTSEIVNYAPEVDKVCRALEAVNLRSSEIFAHNSIEESDERCQAALTEILEILTVVCEAQKLPLAQTWVPCQHGIQAHHDESRKSYSTFNGSCSGQFCISTTNAAFHVVDAHLKGFRDACSEHHLQKGQGVVGKAFSSRRPCFCSDITKFCKTEYPLVHYAQMFGLGGCLALCFQSFHSENDVYAVEFFLPLGCKGPMNYHALLESIFAMVKQNFQNIKLITGSDVNKLPHERIEMITYEDHIIKHIQCALPMTNTSLEGLNEYESNGNATYNIPEERMTTCNNLKKNTNRSVIGSVSASNFITNKISGRKRGKSEKIISLEVLQQYFAGSLKDAAKSLGVCPTTMKRICRKHGISRWPSRKINKVNRSISKLRQVIESFESSDSTFNLNPLVCPLPAAARPDSSVERDEDTPHFKTLEADTKASEGNMKSPVSQASDSNFRNLGHDACGTDNRFSTNSKQFTGTNKFLGDQNIIPLISTTNIIATEREYRDVDMLIENSASSKLVRNPPSTSVPESKTYIIKASYKGDIIRFRLANDANYAALNVEISRRLMLDVGTFDVRYLDEDNDWVNLSCDEDLEECLNLSTFHGSSSAIRLSVQDICTHLGSSCESSSKCSV